ncbi:MAG: hypothetical protein ACQEVA_11455 [Myxococcota bacterium]
MTSAVLLTVALATPALACDGEKNKDDSDDESAVHVQHDGDTLACGGEKSDDDKKDENTFKADNSNELACGGEKSDDDKKDENTFSA